MGQQAQEIIEKFKDKTLKDFVPSFILAQFEQDKSLEYADFDQCVDEYFSQAEKQKEKQKLNTKEQQIFSKVAKI